MTTPLRQFILKRGNTAVSSTYTGPVGEITFDTGLEAIRIHDGITPGGALMPSNAAYNTVVGNVIILQGNVEDINSTLSSLANVAYSGSYTDLSNVPPPSSAGPTVPVTTQSGALWYDSISGRIYVYFDGFWVDASPESLYNLPIASDTVLGGIKVGDNLAIAGDGTLSANIATFGNLTVNDQTIAGTDINGDIVFAPNGTGTVKVPTLAINGYTTLTTGTEVITNIIDRLVVAAFASDNVNPLPAGTYGNPDPIPAPWAAYQFTTVPSPVLQIGDTLAGSGIPANSNVVYVGIAGFETWAITNITPPLAVAIGERITVTRERTNDALILATTTEDTDISLRPNNSYGRIIAGSSIHPAVTDQYNLGTPARRWREIWLGAGTIYVQDETLGIDLAIGAKDGNLYVAGAAGLTVGEFTLVDNKIQIKNPARDIIIGQSNATGNVQFNRPMKVISGLTNNTSFSVSREGETLISTPNLAIGQTMLNLSAETNGQSYLPPQIAGGSLIHVTNAVNVPPILTFDSFGAFAPLPVALVGRRFRGTVSAPAVVQSGDAIIGLTASGYANAPTVTGLPQTGSARFVFVADETFTSTTQAARLDFYSQTPGGNGTEHKVLVVNSGGIVLPSIASGGNGNASITFPNGTTQTTAWLGDASLNGVNANVAAANVQIVALQSNSATQAVQINSIATNAVNVVTAGTGIRVTRNNGTVGIDAIGVQTISGTPNQILVANIANNITLSLPQSINTNSSVTFGNVTVTGNLNIEGSIIASENISLDSKILYLANLASSADQIDGGGIILGNVNAAFKRSITYDLNNNKWDTDGAGLRTLELDATYVHVDGDLFANGTAHFGGAYIGYNFPNAEVQIDSDIDSYSQVVHINHSNSVNASTLFTALNDLGTDGSYYATIGIASSTYNTAFFPIVGPSDSFLLNDGGDLIINSVTPNKVVRFYTSGSQNANLRVTIDDSGLRVVNNVTVGGTLVFSDGSTQTTSANTVINSFTTVFDANLGTATNNITTLFANAAQQANQLTGANAAIITANTGMKSYIDARDTAVTNAWTANAAMQQVSIDSINANVAAANATIITNYNGTINYINLTNAAMIANVNAANAAIITANTGLKSYVDTQDAAITNAWTANAVQQANQITGANAAIVTANSAVVSYVNTQISSVGTAWQANAAFQEDEISGLRANITAANLSITYSNVAIDAANVALVSYVNTQISGVNNNWTANAAFQETEISGLRANITAANSAIVGSTYGNANVATYLPYNATIQAINANVTAANSAISGLQSAGYATITQLNANVSAANTAIVTANTGMKSYVDGQISGVSLAWAGNAAFQETEISGLRANITAANAAIVASTYSNTSVTSYLSTVSSIKLSNIQITDQTIAGTVFGRDMNFTVNDSGASFIFGSNILPSLNYVYTLGNKQRRWAKSYHGPHSIDVDGILLDTDTETAAAGSANLFISNAGGFVANMITSNNGMRANGNVSTSGNVWVTGNVRSNYFLGDGSKLTNLPTGSSFGTSILAGKLSVDPASVSKTSAATQTFTLTGLTTNHKVTVTPGTDLTYGIFITAAYASAADTLSVQFMNISGGSINLGAIDLNYIAWV